jgi:uncharacterized protein YndB with AHSA1/START domain
MSATVTPVFSTDQDAVTMEIQIGAPPDRVFQALTDPSRLSMWWGKRGIYRVTHAEGDLRVGGKWRSAGMGDDGKAFEVTGEYLEIDPPRLLVFTWISSWTTGEPSTVRWDLIPTNRGTLVKLCHSGLAKYPEAGRSYSQGWPLVLGWMQAYVERGETVDTRTS